MNLYIIETIPLLPKTDLFTGAVELFQIADMYQMDDLCTTCADFMMRSLDIDAQVIVMYISGHCGIYYNKRADQLTGEAVVFRQDQAGGGAGAA